MKTTYTDQQLTETLTSDTEVEQFREKIIDNCTKKIIIYTVVAILSLIFVSSIISYGIYTHNALLTGGAVILILPAYWSLFQVEDYQALQKYIKQATTPLAISKRCLEFANLVDNYPEARLLSQQAQIQGRQLYNFDIDAMTDLRSKQLENLWNQQRKEQDQIEKQEEDEACKKIHGLLTT